MKKSEAADVDNGVRSSVADVEQEDDERRGVRNNVVGKVRQTLRLMRMNYGPPRDHHPG